MRRRSRLRQATLGPDHPDTLTSRNNLAQAYLDDGQTARAIEMHEATLKMQESKLGPNHPRVFMSRNNLALAYQRRRTHGRGDQAARGDTTDARVEARPGPSRDARHSQ